MPENAKPHLELAERLVNQVLTPLKQTFVGKDEIIDLMGICLVGGENLFMLGPPGTAKSALVQELGRLIDGRTFDYLLTRFTEPNELFGPFDIRRLREGELVTNTDGMLPEADLIFLDELLNANSAILNSLLLVLNERVFRRGRETRKLPVLMVTGASNHLPEDDSLQALFDRFLLRVHCDNVGNEQLHHVLSAGWELEQRESLPKIGIQASELAELQKALRLVDMTGIRDTYMQVIRHLRHAGMAFSDRRAVKLQRLLAASALLSGRTFAQESDMWVLRYTWDTLEQQEVIAGIVNEAIREAPAQEQEHPRAREAERPSAEELASELESIDTRLQAVDVTGAELAVLKDRVRALAGRCEWVTQAEARDFLQEKLDATWRLIAEKV